MGRRFIDPETGKQITRVEIVERFELAEGRKFPTAEFERYLAEIETFEVTGDWTREEMNCD